MILSDVNITLGGLLLRFRLPYYTRLFAIPDGPRRWYQVILWWELRRIPYNAIVGTVGFICLLALLALFELPALAPKEWDEGPEPFGAIIFGILANVGFTGGWVAELIARWFWRERAAFFGPIMFSLGLFLSVALCLLPPLFAALVWLTTLL